MHPDYVIHYSRGEPFQSITSYPPEKWGKVVGSLNESNAWGLARFSDPNYLSRRIEVEATLRREFIARGGRPMLKNPIYCYLGRHERWEDNELNIGYAIDLKNISPEVISFTYGDSLLAFNDDYRIQSGEKYQNSLCKLVFTLNDLEALFASVEYPKVDPLRIEAQLWTIPSEENIRVINR